MKIRLFHIVLCFLLVGLFGDRTASLASKPDNYQVSEDGSRYISYVIPQNAIFMGVNLEGLYVYNLEVRIYLQNDTPKGLSGHGLIKSSNSELSYITYCDEDFYRIEDPSNPCYIAILSFGTDSAISSCYVQLTNLLIIRVAGDPLSHMSVSQTVYVN